LSLREWLNSSSGRTIGTVSGLLLVGVAGWLVWANTLSSPIPGDARSPMFMCAETGKPFRHTLKIGEANPVVSPHSGKNTGFPAEPCYWGQDGKPKPEPTWVLLNTYAGQPEPTFCPDCRRRVVGQNPAPDSCLPPPPTEAEWKARGGR
jgi:hypothetical protein